VTFVVLFSCAEETAASERIATNASRAWRFFELKEISIPYFLFVKQVRQGKAYHFRSAKLKNSRID
jgi:hypothetical protein